MADVISFAGTLSAVPAAGSPSGQALLTSPFAETLVTKRKALSQVSLDSDSPVPVALGSLAAVHLLVVKVTTGGPKLRLRITSADGSQQAVPVDSFVILESLSVPITAVDLTRVVGIATTAEVLIAEKA